MSANALSAVSLAVLVLLAPHGVGHAQPAPQPLPSAAAAGSPLPRPSVDTLRLLLEAEAAETARLARQALDKARGQDGPTSRAVAVPAAAPGALPTLPASLGGGLPDSLASPPPPKLLEINGPAEDLRARLRLADVEAPAGTSRRRAALAAGVHQQHPGCAHSPGPRGNAPARGGAQGQHHGAGQAGQAG